MSAAKITKMEDQHRRKIRAFGGDPDHPEVLKEYLKVVNLWLRAEGHVTITNDRLLSIAMLHLRDDHDKPRSVANGGSGPTNAEIAEQRKKDEAAEAQRKLVATGGNTL